MDNQLFPYCREGGQSLELNIEKGDIMKLYYSAGSCSTSCHITLEESGLKYEAIGIDWENQQDPNIELVKQLNPLGTLPILLTPQNTQLDQNAAIHMYIADLSPEKKLLPMPGTPERSLALNWLSFICSDLHKAFSPLFALGDISKEKLVQDSVRAWAVENVRHGLSYMDRHLEGKKYLMGDYFTVADAYAFVVINWTQWVGIPLDEYLHIKAYLPRIHERPAVQKVYQEEGLNK